ncbi:hypothetical protein SLS55_004220 [Diplodia seriata]|uniref:Uncharacterized protein n=1 Tax=Diplodia seriata TaxID=420778 RepID=A0ABR3CIS2_9PEZI
MRVQASEGKKVLKPRGIVIFGDEPTFTPQMPHDHFTTDKPKSDDHSAHCKAIAGLQKYTIWLNPTAEFQEPVVEARNAMEQWAEVEDEFEIFAQKHLLLSEPPKRTVSNTRLCWRKRRLRSPSSPRRGAGKRPLSSTQARKPFIKGISGTSSLTCRIG